MKFFAALGFICATGAAQAMELDHFQSKDVLSDAEILSAEPDGEGYRLLVRRQGALYSCRVVFAEVTFTQEKLEFSCVDAR